MRRGMSMAAIKAIGAGMFMGSTPWYRRNFKSHSGAASIRRGKFSKTFQGERECARHRRQIERGIIPQDQLYVMPA